jgi:hypothetical protein
MTRDEKTRHGVPYASFLVRFWEDKDLDGVPTIRAEVYGIQNAEVRRFDSVEATLQYLSNRTQTLGAP